MKIIAIGAVTAGGKTSIVNGLLNKLNHAKALYFDDYTFEGAVDNYYEWVMLGADYSVWNVSPLKKTSWILLPTINMSIYCWITLLHIVIMR